MTPETRKWFKTLQRAWQGFDRSTAYGCQMRRVAFDADVCAENWITYIGLVDDDELRPKDAPS